MLWGLGPWDFDFVVPLNSAAAGTPMASQAGTAESYYSEGTAAVAFRVSGCNCRGWTPDAGWTADDMERLKTSA